MSIWATFFRLDDDTAPIGYHGSHLFPSPLVRDGSVDLALIPGFINPDGPDHDDEDERAAHPLLRLSVNAETVVLDRPQVLEAYEALGDWLVRTGDEAILDPPHVATDGDRGQQLPRAGNKNSAATAVGRTDMSGVTDRE